MFTINSLIVGDLTFEKLNSILTQFREIKIYRASTIEEFKALDEMELLFIEYRSGDDLNYLKELKLNKSNEIYICLIGSEFQDLEYKFIDIYIEKEFSQDVIKLKIERFIKSLKLKTIGDILFRDGVKFTTFKESIRNSKNIFYIQNESDMMDFGIWLSDNYNYYQIPTKECQSMLEFLYKTINSAVNISGDLTILVEQSFDAIYISFKLPRERMAVEDKLIFERDDVVLESGFIYIKLQISETPDIDRRKLDMKKFLTATVDGYKKILSKDSCLLNRVSAIEFIQTLDEEDIYQVEELIELDTEWINLIAKLELNLELESFTEIAKVIENFSVVINKFYTFSTLSNALYSISNLLFSTDLTTLSKDKIGKLLILLSSLREDLSDWRVRIFEEMDIDNIYYLDNSMLSSCIQMESILTDKSPEEFGEVELF